MPLPALLPTPIPVAGEYIPPPPPPWTPPYPDWQVLCAFGFGVLDPTPIFTDVTWAMRSFGTDEGIDHELGRIQASELTMKLWDALGAFTPANTLSPYYNLMSQPDSLGLDSESGGTWQALFGDGSVSTQTSDVLWGPTGGKFTGSASEATYFLTDAYDVTEGQQYTVSVWVKAATVAESLSASITWANGGGDISTLYGTAAADSTSEWTQYTFTGVAPSGATLAYGAISDPNLTTHSHYFTCAGLFYNPDAVPIGWSLGQANPFVSCVPIWVRGTWDSDLEDVSYTFADSWVPVATDPLNQDTNLTAYDVLGLLALAPLSNSLLFPDFLMSLGDLEGYWRLNDPIASSSAASYIGGPPLTVAGAVDFGSQDTTGAGLAQLLSASFSGAGSGALLYDTATAVTLTGVGNEQGFLIAPPGSLFSGDSVWSLIVLVNFGTNNFNGAMADVGFMAGTDASDVTNFSLAIDTSTGQLILEETSGSIPARIEGGPNIFDNQWHLLTIAAGTGGDTLYVNLDETNIMSTGTTGSTTPVGGFSVFNEATGEDSRSGPAVIALQDLAFLSAGLSGPDVDAIYTAYHLLQDYEYSGQRIEKVLRIVGYDTYPADIATGTILCQPETTSQTSTAALDYMLTVTDTELGFLAQTPDGVLRFRAASWIWTNPTTLNSQAVLGDTLDADLNYEPNVKIPQDSLDRWTDVQVQAQQGVGVGVMQEVIDQDAIGPPGGVGHRVLQRTGLLFASDHDAAAQARLLLSRYSTPRKRVDGVTLKAQANHGNNIAQMLSRQLWERLTFQRQGSRESPFDADMLIEHRSHSFKADPGTYEVTWILSPYEVYDVTVTDVMPSDLATWGTVPTLGTPLTRYTFSVSTPVTDDFGSCSVTLPATYTTGYVAVVSVGDGTSLGTEGQSIAILPAFCTDSALVCRVYTDAGSPAGEFNEVVVNVVVIGA